MNTEEMTGMQIIKAHLAAAMLGEQMPSLRGDGPRVLLGALKEMHDRPVLDEARRDELAEIGAAALALLVDRLKESMRAELEAALLLDRTKRLN